MAQTLEDQIVTIERSLGERMIDHALVIVRSWLNELGENNPYEKAFDDISRQYDALFESWLTSDNTDHDETLDRLTVNTYRLVDEVFRALHRKRGIELDSDMLFSEANIMTLIEGINDESDFHSAQCIAKLILLFARYDMRIDFFPDIQDAFAAAVDRIGDQGERVFSTMVAFVAGYDSYTHDMQDIVRILPDTWIYSVLVGESEERALRMAKTYLSIGFMDLLWDRIDLAAQYLLKQLRKGSQKPIDFINYGHCLLLQGDRMMAFENYRQARQLCKSSKDFFLLFRPGRRPLADRGIPLEQIYLLEDQLLKS